MNNNNNPGGQVPDYRLNEIMEEMRKMRDENQRLRGTIDHIYAQQNQRQQQPQEQDQPLFEPQIEQALEKKIRKMVEPVAQQSRNQMGMLYDKNDLLEFQLRYGPENYNKYSDKIETLRQQATHQGKYLTREEAYKLVYFEETNKKPQQKPVEAQPNAVAPQFDPYTGMVMQPQTQPQQAPQQPAQQPQQVQPQVPQQQPQQIQTQQQPAEDFNLPMDVATSGSRQQPVVTRGLDLTTEDRGLDAWADKYGDVPL